MPTVTAPPRRNPVVTRVILLVGLLGLVAALVWQVYQAQKPSTGGDPTTDNPALRAVQTFDYVGGQHTEDPVTYAQTPPAGGPHDPVWDDCGAYSAPIRDENGVHDLEHGTVWITYRPDLKASDIQSLQGQLETLQSKKWILSPYPGLPAPAVVTVWNAQLDLDAASDSRLPIFLKEYGDGHTAPEAAFASCEGGKQVMASADNP